MIRTLLVANRGEVVARVARTARRLGIGTVAIASDADRGAPFTASCERVVAIGGARAEDSYLRIDAVIAAARASGADAVHPGYGFLSESAAFAAAVEAAGLVWIGPPPAAMRAMADKAAARQRMSAAGVPVLPGYDGKDQSPATLREEARRLGWPLMVKAAAGGGGRGMRRIDGDDGLDAALAWAAAEARAAFGDARLLLERAVDGARHVEIQLLADAHGGGVHLGERDCSLQRRHQKLIEEAPSPAVSADLRRQMGAVAVRVAREVGYVGAGTVEFLLEASGAFWFIEMNTRLQVEHAVTEALVGLDLVEWQLRVADGEALPCQQEEMLDRFESGGHAIECRLCAEDPAAGFLPQSGRIVRWRAPTGVRTEHAVADGATVPPYYDSMLAKLVAHAPTRAGALAQLAGALDETVCWGVTTNRAFLARTLRDPAFARGEADTGFISRRWPDDAARATPAPCWLEAAAAASIALLPRATLPRLWGGWSSSPALDTTVPIDVRGIRRAWHLAGTRDAFAARSGDSCHRIEQLERTRTGDAADFDAIVDGRPLRVLATFDAGAGHWQADGHELTASDLRLQSVGRERAVHAGVLVAPMHGRVTQACVATGSEVAAGALLVVIEAMKMEHQIRAPHAGRVASLHVRTGDQVAARQPLVEVTP